MRQYLAEGIAGAYTFIVDRSKPPVIESRPNGGSVARIPGRFSVCDCVNGNNRRYSKRVWEKNLTPGSPLQEAIKRNAAFGLLEHPKDGLVTLQSPISHQVVSAQMVESKDADGKVIHEVMGEIALYNPTLIPESGKLMGLIEGGYNPLVSSRGYGSLKRGADGVDNVEEDYVCESWDVVIKPSFESAELTPQRPALSTSTPQFAAPVSPNPTAESLQPAKTAPVLEAETAKNLKESSPSSGSSSSPATASNKHTTKNMEINEIKTRVTALRGLEPTKLSRFAESMGQIEDLHQQVCEWAAADPKRSWEAQKLHKELDSLSETWTQSARLPIKEAKRLTEQNGKLMRVINATAQTAVTYKKKLGEAIKGKRSGQKMVEELTRRGQGWQRLAESRKAKFLALEHDFDTSCEALDLMAQRYHEDVTELGRRVIVLEFKDKAQTPEIQKALKEATRLRHIAVIREKLEGPKKDSVQEADALKQPKEGEVPSKEGIKDEKVKGAGSPESGKVAAEPGKVKTESNDAKPAAPAITEARVLTQSRDIRDLSESIGLVQRLSGSVK